MAENAKMKDTFRSVCFHSLEPSKPATITDSDRQKKLLQRIEENRIRTQNAIKNCRENDSVMKNDQTKSSPGGSRKSVSLSSKKISEPEASPKERGRSRSKERSSEDSSMSRSQHSDDPEGCHVNHSINGRSDVPLSGSSVLLSPDTAESLDSIKTKGVATEQKEQSRRKSSRSRDRLSVNDLPDRPQAAPRMSRSVSDPGGGQDSYTGVIRSVSQGSEGHETEEWRAELSSLQEEVRSVLSVRSGPRALNLRLANFWSLQSHFFTTNTHVHVYIHFEKVRPRSKVGSSKFYGCRARSIFCL